MGNSEPLGTSVGRSPGASPPAPARCRPREVSSERDRPLRGKRLRPKQPIPLPHTRPASGWRAQTSVGPSVRAERELRALRVAAATGGDIRAPRVVPVALDKSALSKARIRIEVRRGATTVIMEWPAAAARECAEWLGGVVK